MTKNPNIIGVAGLRADTNKADGMSQQAPSFFWQAHLHRILIRTFGPNPLKCLKEVVLFSYDSD